MSKLKIALIVIAVLAVLIVIGVSVLMNNLKKTYSTYNNFNYSSLDLSMVEDGTYTGSEDAGIVKATVEVNVKDHKITKVTIVSHDCGKGKPAEVIVDDIVKQNNLDVDTISGATLSSNVIRVAVYNALTK